MNDTEPQRVAEYLTHKLLEERAVLFVGAGFSQSACDSAGRNLPSGPQLAAEIWDLLDTEGPLDSRSSLADVYQVALQGSHDRLRNYLIQRLRVDPGSLPDFYGAYYRMPWRRAYSLNIDDLEAAAAVRFTLGQQVLATSGVPHAPGTTQRSQGSGLEVVHLNGILEHAPKYVTFSRMQYAQRSAAPDPHYARLAAELVDCAVVFVGTGLDEESLWSHMSLRKQRKGYAQREMRKRSFLVVPSLSVAKQRMLREFNILWLEMSAEEFASGILERVRVLLDARERSGGVSAHHVVRPKRLVPVGDVLRDEAGVPSSDYLIGREPNWGDISSGLAIERDIDAELLRQAEAYLDDESSSNVLVLQGLAGSGKSTSLKRLCLALDGEGYSVGFTDRHYYVSAEGLLREVREQSSLRVVAIDEARRYGNVLHKLIEELRTIRSGLLIVVALHAAAEQSLLEGLSSSEGVSLHTLPGLTDADIDKLLDVLERHKRLGILTDRSHEQRVSAFKDQAGRQLLVAMIQATSGKRFEEMVVDEFNLLSPIEQHVYASVAVATGRGFDLRSSEVLIAVNQADNEILNVINILHRKSLLVHPKPSAVDRFQVRHRQIARILTEQFARDANLRNLIEGVVFAVACDLSPREGRRSRPWAIVKSFIGHRYLFSVLGLMDSRWVYTRLEEILGRDFHYWLQRGSMEVMNGDLHLARRCLDTARSLDPDDPFVITEYAYLEMKLASNNPEAPGAEGRFKRSLEGLESVIRARRAGDAHAIHVYCSQVIRWCGRANIGVDLKRDLLNRALTHARNGRKEHPSAKDLEGLPERLTRELMMIHVER